MKFLAELQKEIPKDKLEIVATPSNQFNGDQGDILKILSGY
jgi:glutathione peroxidase-family protein